MVVVWTSCSHLRIPFWPCANCPTSSRMATSDRCWRAHWARWRLRRPRPRAKPQRSRSTNCRSPTATAGSTAGGVDGSAAAWAPWNSRGTRLEDTMDLAERECVIGVSPWGTWNRRATATATGTHINSTGRSGTASASGGAVHSTGRSAAATASRSASAICGGCGGCCGLEGRGAAWTARRRPWAWRTPRRAAVGRGLRDHMMVPLPASLWGPWPARARRHRTSPGAWR